MTRPLQRRYGCARRSRKPVALNEEQAVAMLVATMAAMLGGEGWGDPRLPELVLRGRWMTWPAYEKTVDTAYVQAQANELIEQGFDPRHLV